MENNFLLMLTFVLAAVSLIVCRNNTPDGTPSPLHLHVLDVKPSLISPLYSAEGCPQTTLSSQFVSQKA